MRQTGEDWRLVRKMGELRVTPGATLLFRKDLVNKVRMVIFNSSKNGVAA